MGKPCWKPRDAVRATVVYADLFDFPLDPTEIHRDLIGLATLPTVTRSAIAESIALGELATDGRWVVLPGRQGLAENRLERSDRATHLWPTARRFGGLLASLPFVRMVAVTGSLAAENPDAMADLDYLIVTAPGRLWLVRALAVAVVRLARLAGAQICPNFLLSTRALALDHDDLFTAHELLQAQPIAGGSVYRQLLAQNDWARQWLPNRFRRAEAATVPQLSCSLGRRITEAPLAGTIGDRLEAWEARRKRERLDQASTGGRFTADVCEGHFDNHRGRVLRQFKARCRRLGITLPGFTQSFQAETRADTSESREPGGRFLAAVRIDSMKGPSR